MGLTAGNPYPQSFQRQESFALELDAADPLAEHRSSFFLPELSAGQETIYFCSHSLGLQPRNVLLLMGEELSRWAMFGVEGHFKGATAWYTYPDLLSEPAARLVGAEPGEVIHMNGLTINLHLMMETFYRPSGNRFRVLMDEPTFPSDLFAVQAQLQRHGIDPADGLLTLQPRSGEYTLREEDIEAFLGERGPEIALVLWSGVNFLTGQRFDMQRITTAAKRQGCVVGFDLAHAAGNVPLQLHDWNIDFAVWCTYKYLNSGPGSVAGCFVHEQHGARVDLPRLAGWWGNAPHTRFRMQLEPHFRAQRGAAGWQVSNPPILALLPLRASLALYDEAGLAALRGKSTCLTSYLFYLLDQQAGSRYEIITPRDPEARGCQLSMLVRDQPRELLAALTEHGVSGDFREPNIIRVAPVPFYNTFHEVWRFAEIWAKLTR
jgi:kynureninase